MEENKEKDINEINNKYFTNDFSKEIWETNYKLKTEKTIEETWSRVAKAVASVEKTEKLQNEWEQKFYKALENFKLIPGGRILANAGGPNKATSLINCFTSPKPESDVDSLESILWILNRQALTLKSEGGWGCNFSFIRPRGSYIKGIGVRSPGSVKYMEIFDKSSEIITEGPGSYELAFEDYHAEEKTKIRKGAMMMILDIWHPDIEEFITAKRKPNHLTKANLSVNVSNSFMDKLLEIQKLQKEGAPQEQIDALDVWELIFPDTEHEAYKTKWFGNIQNWVDAGYPVKCYRKVKVTELWDRIMKSTYDFADPGVLFLDIANQDHCANYLEKLHIDATNPCLTGDTVVAVADGRTNVTIKQLADEGKDVPVLACDDEDKIVTKLMRNPRITGYNQDIYRVTLDDGNHIDCTANHKFRLSDGSYKEVKDMTPGESLAVFAVTQLKFSEAFPSMNSNSQTYNWVEQGKNRYKAVHRLNVEYKLGRKLKPHEIVHHKDYNALNNALDNLEVMSKKAHDRLHAETMRGDNNPMCRAHTEWSEEKWTDYRNKQRLANVGGKNANYKGVSNEKLLSIAQHLIKKYGRFFSMNELQDELRRRHLHVFRAFNEDYRKEFFGGTGLRDICKYAAESLSMYAPFMDHDARLQKTYVSAIEQGYEAEIKNNLVYVKKTCEQCGDSFFIPYHKREVAFCSVKCSTSNERVKEKMKKAATKSASKRYARIKQETRYKQLKTYTDLQFSLKRTPWKTEFEERCKAENIPFRFGPHSPFRTYKHLQEESVNFNHRVVSIEYIGKQDVYNGTVDDVHNFCVGMFETVNEHNHPKFFMLNNKQCGEQCMPPGFCCNLSSINLTQFVEYDPTTHMTLFNYEAFKDIVHIGVRFLDNVLEIANTPLKDYETMIKRYRRIGLGVTGIGSTLAMLGMDYANASTEVFLHNIMSVFNSEAIKCSIALGKEKGSFEGFDKDKHLKNLKATFPYVFAEEWQEIENMESFRNSSLFSIQPTGNTGCLANCISGGIEPVFEKTYIRTVTVPVMPDNIKDKVPRYWEGDFTPNEYFKPVSQWGITFLTYTDPETNIVYKIFQDRGLCKEIVCEDYSIYWLKRLQQEHGCVFDMDYRCAMDLSCDEHLKILATMAKHIDSSQSKTINVASDYPYEDFKNIYINAYRTKRIKGVTTYRDKTKAAVLNTKSQSECECCKKIAKTTAPKRPKTLPCKVHLMTIKGIAYYAIVSMLGEDPYEVFIGQNKEDIKNEDGEYVGSKLLFFQKLNGCEGELTRLTRGKYTFKSKDGKIEVPIIRTEESEDTALITAFSRILSWGLRHGGDIKFAVDQLEKTEGSFSSATKVFSRVLKKYIKQDCDCSSSAAKVKHVCPKCGAALVFSEGCKHCAQCGWSACG